MCYNPSYGAGDEVTPEFELVTQLKYLVENGSSRVWGYL
jgi:hypothetical protein